VLQAPLAAQHKEAHPSHPPGWDTFLFGLAYGNCNRGPLPKPLPRKKAIHVGNGALFPLHNHAAQEAERRAYQQVVLENAQDVSRLEEV
jgi:hypothetical protein